MSKNKINLLSHEGFEYTVLGRVVSWSLNVGRVIVIMTEFVVVSAFLSRFWFDRQLTDLNEKLQEQTLILKSYASFEQEFNLARTKLEHFTEVIGNSRPMEKDVQKILGATPGNIALSQVSADNTAIQISGFASFEGAVDGFINKLSSLNIGEVELSNLAVSPDEQLGIRFTIVIGLPEKKI